MRSTLSSSLLATALVSVLSLSSPSVVVAQSAPAASAAAPVTIDVAKRPLIDKILTLWHPETVALVMVQRPAADALQQSRIAMQGRVSADRQEATLKEIAGDAQRYVDEVTPLAQAAATRQLPGTVGVMLAENFSVDELRQLIAMLESRSRRSSSSWCPGWKSAWVSRWRPTPAPPSIPSWTR